MLVPFQMILLPATNRIKILPSKCYLPGSKSFPLPASPTMITSPPSKSIPMQFYFKREIETFKVLYSIHVCMIMHSRPPASGLHRHRSFHYEKEIDQGSLLRRRVDDLKFSVVDRFQTHARFQTLKCNVLRHIWTHPFDILHSSVQTTLGSVEKTIMYPESHVA